MKVAVYLGSSLHCLKEYNELAFETGVELAKAGHTVIYGGSDVGTMRDLAEGVQSVDGEVIGVFPKDFKGTREVREKGIKVIRDGLTEMYWVKDFAERKMKMEELSDCCLVLPGSFGTLDELFTYACDFAIGTHSQKAYILDYKGFYSPLKTLLENTRTAGFLKPETYDALVFCDSVQDFLQKVQA